MANFWGKREAMKVREKGEDLIAIRERIKKRGKKRKKRTLRQTV